jgi:hypothetical protein
VGKAAVFNGVPQPLGRGTVATYVTLDNAGNPTELGIRLSASALDGLPTEKASPANMTMLEFPAQAGRTDFNHATLDWNPHGHPPVGVFTVPHFDFHFYMSDEASVMAIDPHTPAGAAEAAHLPAPRYVPAGYAPELGPPAVTAVPAMGLHWLVDPAAFVPHHYDFTQVLLNGSWDGRYTFVEPMVTRAWLLTKAGATGPVTQPAAFQRSGWFPTSYHVGYDPAADQYVIALTGLAMHQAS